MSLADIFRMRPSLNMLCRIFHSKTLFAYPTFIADDGEKNFELVSEFCASKSGFGLFSYTYFPALLTFWHKDERSKKKVLIEF